MALSSYKYALIAPRLEKILAQNAAPKVPEWQSYGKFRKVTLNPHFSEKEERGDQGKFFKNRQKSSPCFKGPKALWRKLNYTVIKMHLKCKDENILAQTAAPKVSEWASYGNYRKVTQNPHLPKKCKGRTKGNFSKIPQKLAFALKAHKHSRANGIIL